MELLIYSIAWGFFTAMAASWMDSAMDYGKIFSNVRYFFAQRAAAKAGMTKMFESRSKQIEAMADFHERLTAMDELYWLIAAYRKPLVSMLCGVCLGTRIHAIATITLIFISGPILLEDFTFYFFSGAVSYYFIK